MMYGKAIGSTYKGAVDCERRSCFRPDIRDKAMKLFLNSPSSDDFEIARAALAESEFQGTDAEMREHVVDVISTLLPDYQIDSSMVDALVVGRSTGIIE